MEKLSQSRIDDLKAEIQMAEALNKEELEPKVVEALQRYTGEWVPRVGMDWDVLLNEFYPIIENNQPSIFFKNPRAFLKPRNKTFISKRRNPFTENMEEVVLDSQKSAGTQEAILNYSLGEINYKHEVRMVLKDSLLFPHGVMWHGYKGNWGMTEEQAMFIKQKRTFVKRISPLRFLKDPAVSMSNIQEGRWIARIIDIPMQDLLEDDQLDVDKRLIKGFHGFGDKVGTMSAMTASLKQGALDSVKVSTVAKSLLEFAGEKFKQSLASKFVRTYEVFLRPTKKEQREGHPGWIALLTFEQEKPLRISDWSLKAEGWPAKVLQFNEIPDMMFGLSDIDTYKQICDLKNIIRNLQIRNAQENTKVWVGISKAGANEEDLKKVQEGTNTIITFEDGDPRERMFVASPGGAASSELYIIDQRLQKELEDKSGVTDLKRGFIHSGEESAASVKLRAAGGSARPLYRQDIMADFLKESLHYLNQLNRQFIPFKDAVRIVGSLDIEWSENPTKEDVQADVDVEIDVISMLPEDPQKELAEFGQALTLMIDGIRDPIIAQKLAQEGKILNLSPLIEQMLIRLRINNPDVFRNIKPEESEGFVSVKEIREAKENVNAALTNQQVPFPPTPEDDHLAKVEVYSTISELLKAAGQVSDALEQLIAIHQAFLQQVEEKNSQVGSAPKLEKPQFQPV